MTSVLPDPRSMVRVLMRGDRATGRHGKTGVDAVLAVSEQYALPVSESLLLVPYAYGYACGLAGVELSTRMMCEHHRVAATEGYADGLRTDPGAVLPAEAMA